MLGLEGELDPELGWVEDYNAVAAALRPVRAELDHRCLNEIGGLENPTAELLAVWIYERLRGDLPLLTDVTVCETPGTEARYPPEGHIVNSCLADSVPTRSSPLSQNSSSR